MRSVDAGERSAQGTWWDPAARVRKILPAHPAIDRDRGTVGIDIDEQAAGFARQDRSESGRARATNTRHARDHGATGRRHVTGLGETIHHPPARIRQFGHVLCTQRHGSLPRGRRSAVIGQSTAPAYDDHGFTARQGARCR
jgi:hypothetical protein